MFIIIKIEIVGIGIYWMPADGMIVEDLVRDLAGMWPGLVGLVGFVWNDVEDVVDNVGYSDQLTFTDPD